MTWNPALSGSLGCRAARLSLGLGLLGAGFLGAIAPGAQGRSGVHPHLAGRPGIRAFIDYVNYGVMVVLAKPHAEPLGVPDGTQLNVGGWAIGNQGSELAKSVFVTVDGKRSFRSTYGLKRPDVAAALHNGAFLRSGFAARIPSGSLGLGMHTLRLRVQLPSGSSYVPPQTVRFETYGGQNALAHYRRLRTATLSYIDFLQAGSASVAVSRPHQQPDHIPAGKALTLTGWAADVPGHAAAGGVFIDLDGTAYFAASYGAKRPDVARALHSAAYTRTGFSAILPTSVLNPGNHRLSLLVLNRTRTALYASGGVETIRVG